MNRLKPNMQRHMARLEDGSDFDGERLTARVALIDADAGTLALQRPGTIDYAAFRADASVHPKLRFDVGISGGFATETGFVENRPRHQLSPCQRIYNA